MKRIFLILALGLALLLFANGRWVVPAAAWAAPIFIIRGLRLTPRALALPLGAAVFMAAAGHVYRGIIPPGLGIMTYALTAYFGFLAFAPFALDRIAAPRRPGLRGTLVFPAAAVTFEYVSTLIFGDWGSAAFSQRGNLALLQMVSLTGIWGPTFLVSWLGPLINAMWESGWKRSIVARATGAFTAAAAAVLLFGGARISIFPADGATVHVAALTLPEGTTNATARSTLLDMTDTTAHDGAAIVVWPEGAFAIDGGEEPELLAAGKDAAVQGGIHLLMAYFVEASDAGGRGMNKAAFIGPDGRILWEYLKAHPVPGSTDVPGDGRIPIVETPHGKIAAAICYDMDFPSLIRQAGRAGADIMLVPGWDWPAINPLHTEMAVVRAVENGFSMVRATEEGLSIAVDYQGRTLAAMDDGRTTRNVMTADVPTKGAWTLYRLIGDAFAWLCAAGLGWLVMAAGRKRSPAPV